MVQVDALQSRTGAGGLAERKKGGVTLTLKVVLRATDAHKSEKPRLIHEFAHTRREDVNKKRVQSENYFFFLNRPV